MLKLLIWKLDLTQFTTAKVNNGSSISLEYKVDQPGSMLRWNFWTDDKDIGFGVYRRQVDKAKPDENEELEELVASHRVNSHVIPEADTFPCDTAGTYVVKFDNSYSWMKAKKVWYFIEVVEPDTSQELSKAESTSF